VSPTPEEAVYPERHGIAMRVVSAALTLVLLTLPVSAQPARFAIRIPAGVQPEPITIFYTAAPSGQMPKELKVPAGVHDVQVPLASRYLRVLAIAPGYQTITAEFRDAQLDSPYVLPLTPLPAARVEGRLVDSAGQPIPDYALRVSYQLSEAIDYFCKCMLDGQIPILDLGSTRTDASGAFSLSVPDPRHDPFFRPSAERGASPGIVMFQSGADRLLAVWSWDDSLRPSHMSLADATAKPLVLTHVERGVLTGRLGTQSLARYGLGDLQGYAFTLLPLRPDGSPDGRPMLLLQASPVDGDTGYLAANALLTAEGTFEVTLPPDTYDLTLSVLGSGGTLVRRIAIAKGLVLHEGERLVLNMP
jgi:hypothetical protein